MTHLTHSLKSKQVQFFLFKLARGEYGLKKTAISYGLAPLLIFSILFVVAFLLGETLFLLILMLGFLVYSPFVILGLIYSALHYDGENSGPRLSMILAGSWLLVYLGIFFLFVFQL